MGTTVTKTEQLQQDLDYITATVRRREQPVGIPALYLFWATAVLVGFFLKKSTVEEGPPAAAET